ncbi:CaiB/BaiF CoA transferase family protein [Chloroflexota bacterium]
MAKLPLEGVRVIAIEDKLALPWGTKMLADLGAEVIVVESHKRENDRIRGGGMILYPDNKPEGKFWNQSSPYFSFYRNKMDLTLDLTKPEAIEIFKELIKISDVVAQNFRPGAMKRRGLDYESLKKIKPDLIYLSSSGYGEEGPWQGYAAFARTVDGMAGLSDMCGYVDGEPVIANPSYIDTSTAWSNALAILMALHYRQRTGKGQHIDNSMYEVGVTCIGEALMDYQMNGRMPTRQGNRHTSWAPHGCYRCQGDDKWVTIAVRSDEEWEKMVQAMGSPEWAKDSKYADSPGRWENQDELDKNINQWTENKEYYEVMRLLQGVGIPAGPVLDSKGLLLDPHLKEREFFPRFKGSTDMQEAGVGALPALASPFNLSRTPSSLRFLAGLGEHNEYILGELLGKSEAEIAKLYEDDVIGKRPDIPEGWSPEPIPLDALKKIGSIRDYDVNYKEILGI